MNKNNRDDVLNATDFAALLYASAAALFLCVFTRWLQHEAIMSTEEGYSHQIEDQLVCLLTYILLAIGQLDAGAILVRNNIGRETVRARRLYRLGRRMQLFCWVPTLPFETVVWLLSQAKDFCVSTAREAFEEIEPDATEGALSDLSDRD